MNPFSQNPNANPAVGQPPIDLNTFLKGIGSTGLNSSGMPVGSTGGLVPLQRSEQDQLTAFTAPSQAGYNGSVTNPLQKLNDLLGIQAPQQEMRVPQSQFALPQGNVQGAVKTPTMGMPSSTPMIGDNSHIKAPAPTPISAFGEQVRTQGPQTRNGATFSATDNGFSIVQDPATVPAQGGGLPQFLQGVSPQTIAPVINAMKAGGDPEQVRQALLAGAPVPQGLSAEQQAAWTLEQAALGQQSAALYDQIRASGIGNKQYGQGMLTGAYNQALGGSQGVPGLTPVKAMAGQIQTRQDAMRMGGQPMTSTQMDTLRKSGFDFKATPAGDGTYIVKDVSPFGPTNKPTTEESVTTQEATMRSKAAFEDNQALSTLAQSAETAVRDIDRASALIDAGAKTQFGGNWLLQGKQLGKALGIPGIEGVKETEELRTLFGNFIMARVQQTKGAISNKEMKLFEEFSPSLDKTPEGNKAILSYAKQAYDRSRQIGQLVDSLRRQNISEGEIRRQVNDFREANPLDDSVLRKPSAETGSGLTGQAREDRKAELRAIIQQRSGGKR